MQAVASSVAKSPLALHRTIASIRAARRVYDASVKVGFVPTMGALHKGMTCKGEIAKKKRGKWNKIHLRHVTNIPPAKFSFLTSIFNFFLVIFLVQDIFHW